MGEALNNVYVISPLLKQHALSLERSHASRLHEAIGLAQAIPIDLVGFKSLSLSKIIPATYIGHGHVEDLKGVLDELDVDVVIVDAALSPVQQRNLERAWKVKVIDRTGLILEIFGDRARTAEGVLQVELAALQYQRSRLVRSWTHLERQRGGFGFTGGPGESQLELDRRMIDTRMMKIKEELAKVVRTRRIQRSSRARVPYPIIALVGYTNAGKSTLFNTMTGADVLSQDILFATLDPTLREMTLPNGASVILSDTVGFISELPTSLVAAFRATLEEVLEADIIVHVRDISHEDTEAQKHDVEHVLTELGLDIDTNHEGAKPCLEVWNKIDALDTDVQNVYRNQAALKENVIITSATLGLGIDDVLHALEKHLTHTDEVFSVSLPLTAGALLSWCYDRGGVMKRQDDPGDEDTHRPPCTHLTLRLSPVNVRKFWRMYNLI